MVWLPSRIRMNQSLKIRVEFNKGRVGMPLPKLVAAEAGPREVWGEVQGVVHAFFKEVERPYLKIRELSTRQLVNCYFEPAMYGAAVEILSDPQAVVFVEGWLREDRETGQVTDIEVTDFRLAPEFPLASYRAGLGAVPDYTGALSTSEFIDRMRHHGQ